MDYSRIISIRKLGAPSPPTIVRVRAYPTAIDELLTSELAAQYLRTLRMMRGKIYQLINNYLEGKVSEEELKREYIRYISQAEDITYATMVLVDFSYLIEDLENSIVLVEKAVEYICANKNKLNDFDIFFVKNIVNWHLERVFNYKKSLDLLRKSIKDKLVELRVIAGILDGRLKKNRRRTTLQRSNEVAAMFMQYKWAFTELLAVQLSMNIGLISCYDELLKLMDLLAEKNQLEAQLLVGEIDKRKYSKRILEIRTLMHDYRTAIMGKIEKYKEIKATIDTNGEYLKEVLGSKSFKRLRKALNASEKSLKIINSILEKIESGEIGSTLEEY